MRRLLSRVARMDRAELAWRGAAAARIAGDRMRAALISPRWDRHDLLAALAPLPELAAVRTTLAAGRWRDAHRELSRHFATISTPRRFVIHRAMKDALADHIRGEFPDSAHDASVRANRLLAGEYDLLGYRGLRFSPPALAAPPDRPDLRDLPDPRAVPDWHRDPVNDRRAPQAFWSSVPYLDSVCGDHKIIWELNRHQHWLALGRAYWLTGDAKYRARVIAELTSWMQANPPLTGINWASMLELAFRSLSWLWALQFFVESEAADDQPWTVDLLLGLDRQLTQVERNLSYYFSPNTHLLGEALALYVAGCALPELAASARRAATGRRILAVEMDRQIAADGGHCERSAHYHRYALDFYLLALAVARATGDPMAADFERAAGRLSSAARLLADDAGRLPHFGDDDGGALLPLTGREPDDARDSLALAAALLNRPDLQIGGPVEETLWFGESHAFQIPHSRFRIASQALPDTGYYVSRSPNGDHLVIDAGPHGHQNGGHAHADALSLTFTVRGVPLLIDPGTACYTTDPELRDRLRSSAMHNTVTIDGRSQSVPNGPFHWTHAAQGRMHRWVTENDFDWFDGAHDGYAPIEHRRRVLARHGDLLVVADFVDADGRHTAAVHWHFDPRWTVDVNGRRATCSLKKSPAHSAVVLIVPDGSVEVFSGDEGGLGWYSPAYGRLEPTTALRVTREGEGPFWIATVFGLDAANPIIGVAWVAGGTLRITRARSVDEVAFVEPDVRKLFRRQTNDQRPTTKDYVCAVSQVS
jgi:uncharacterized heparinase superfamily protein